MNIVYVIINHLWNLIWGQPLKEFLVSAGFGADRSKNSWSQLDLGSIAQSCWSQLVWHHGHIRTLKPACVRRLVHPCTLESTCRAQSW